MKLAVLREPRHPLSIDDCRSHGCIDCSSGHGGTSTREGSIWSYQYLLVAYGGWTMLMPA